jgi:fatty acid desaturase
MKISYQPLSNRAETKMLFPYFKMAEKKPLLRNSKDIPVLVFLCSFMILNITAFSIAEYSTVSSILYVLLLSQLSFTTATIVHNVQHCRIFNSSRLNSSLNIILTLLFGHPVSTFISGHNLSHHKLS